MGTAAHRQRSQRFVSGFVQPLQCDEAVMAFSGFSRCSSVCRQPNERLHGCLMTRSTKNIKSENR